MKLFLLLVLLGFNSYAEFSKISQQGVPLPVFSKQWSCVVDKSGLMWEVKTSDFSLHSSSNTYIWYDKQSGVANNAYSRNCSFYDFCNTDLYIEVVNDIGLCGYYDWRLPSFTELSSLKQFRENEPLIDTDFFPNTQAGRYWTSTTYKKDSAMVLDVVFFYGGSSGTDKDLDAFIRLVRSDDNEVIRKSPK